MTDREKIVTALECCKNKTCEDVGPDVVCPYIEWLGEYETAYRECTERLADDVLSLLKAQESEPITAIRCGAHAQGADDVWYQCGKCGGFLGVIRHSKPFCPQCGRAVKW